MKNKFIKSTLILTIGGLITKVLGLIIKIIYTRLVGSEGISLYAIVIPTYSLLITIITLALPTSISKLVAENKKKSLKIISNAFFIVSLINVFIITIMLLSSKFIANNLLNEPDSYFLLLAITFTLPFISISAILKGYFYGKQNMLPNTISNIFEEIVKGLLIIFVLPIFLEKNLVLGIFALIMFNIVTEITSIITFLFFIPKHKVIHKSDLKVDLSTSKDILDISLPTVSSRLIGNIGYFFEPIILTNILIYIGYSKDFVILNYGIYNSYTIALMAMPSFFIMAISTSLIPEISRFYYNKNIKMVKKRFKEAIIFTSIIGIISTIILTLFGQNILMFLYNTTEGLDYLKVLLPFFVLFYLEAPLISTLQAIGKPSITMKITLYGVIIKLLTLTISSFFSIGIYGLILAEIINIIFVFSLNSLAIKKVLFN